MSTQWLSVLLVSAFLLELAIPSTASTIHLSFSASGFRESTGAPAPAEPVSGMIVYDADSDKSPINQLLSMSLSIAGHAYSVQEVAFSGDPQDQLIGGVVLGVDAVSPGTNDFAMVFNPVTVHPFVFLYSVAATNAVWFTTTFDQFTIAELIAPTGQAGPTFQFRFPTASCLGLIYCYVDPVVASGYRYSTGDGDPNFASVTLPFVGANAFTLSFEQNGQQNTSTLAAGIRYDFPLGGVSSFLVTGIDPGANVDPNNPLAFPTGVTFVSDGEFTGTMTALTANSGGNVPEPATIGLLVTALTCALSGRHRRSS
jgi:hypothetical protein